MPVTDGTGTACRSKVRVIAGRTRVGPATMDNHQVRALLMGGQARVFHSVAEFNRDTHLLTLPEAAAAAALESREVACVVATPDLPIVDMGITF